MTYRAYRSSLRSLFDATEKFLRKDDRMGEETALLVVCSFITLAVMVFVVLSVSLPTATGGLYSISLGGMVIAVCLAYRFCTSYVSSAEEVQPLAVPEDSAAKESALWRKSERAAP